MGTRTPEYSSPDFSVLLFGYSADGGAVRVVDLAGGEELPEEILAALTDDSVIKTAHNAAFERICLSRFLGLPLGTYLPPYSWRCTMVWAACLGLPQSLAEVGAVLGLEKRKLEAGGELVRYFCIDGHQPPDDPAGWELFKAYNARDVEAELEIRSALERYPVPGSVWEEWFIDQEINDRGVGIDTVLAASAVKLSEESLSALKERMAALTGLENPASAAQLKGWLAGRGIEAASLGRKEIESLLPSVSGDVREVLELRLKLSRSSVSKYGAMMRSVCADGRARGMFRFCGAGRTGRFSGRLIQLQNLPQNHMDDLHEARELVRRGDFSAVEARYGDVQDVLSQLVRTAFVPRGGDRFFVADFSAIEARVLAWLAGETWRSRVFASGGDIYSASASRMFDVPVEKNGVNAHLRQKGKIAELALGYGGSSGALKQMGAAEMGLTECEIEMLVRTWRENNPDIVRLWRRVGRAAIRAVDCRTEERECGLGFSYMPDFLFITLPSGRRLSYFRPRVCENRFGSPAVSYEGAGQGKAWERTVTYGAKLTENIVQGISRDILCFAMRSLRDERICMHVHDELVIEAGADRSIEEFTEIMGRTPPWAPGLLLKADGYVTEFYKKE